MPALTDFVFFTPSVRRQQIHHVLEELAGERRRGYYEWVEWVGAHPEVEPAPGYFEWKRALLERIDPRYRRIFYDGAPAKIRLEEVVSGGVRLAGIPAIDDPPVVPASAAGFLRDGEKVFGVVAGGEARAYPVRVLSWHEMLNDVVGGEPITLSFCTLCGSGLVYSTRTPAGGSYTLDTSGLLYRSNKLMVDRQTWTLWSNLTGEAVIGRLAAANVSLELLPSTVTTWEEWRARHPETLALDVPALEDRVDRRLGFVYREGAADRARAGVSFPVPARSDRLDDDAEVYALRLGSAAKAYPVEAVTRRGVVNDSVGGEPVVLVGDPASGSVRAYRRGERSFRRAADGALLDDLDRSWRVGELALTPTDAESEPLLRVPGTTAFWFGWFAFYPQTEVYDE